MDTHNEETDDETIIASEPDHSRRPDDDARFGKRSTGSSKERRARGIGRHQDDTDSSRYEVQTAKNSPR